MSERAPASAWPSEVFEVSLDDPVEAARASTKLFIRDEMHVAPYRGSGKGKVLAAFEALSAFGSPALAGLMDRSCSPFVTSDHEIGGVLRHGREVLGLSRQDVAEAADVALEFVTVAEGGRRTMPVRELLRMARSLGLEDWRLGTFAPRHVGPLLGVLRGFAAPRPVDASDADGTSTSVRVVLDLARAAWLLEARSRLEAWLGRIRVGGEEWPPRSARRPDMPPWEAGAAAARTVREWMRLGDGPVPSVTAMAEALFGVPVVHMPLEAHVAGAVVRRGRIEGVVANVEGPGSNPGMMRLTIAHELCRLLDGSALARIGVGEPVAEVARDEPGERRAQAFASELLLPNAVAARAVALGGTEALPRLVEAYGVSRAVAENQARLGGASVRRPSAPQPAMRPSIRWRRAEAPDRSAFGADLAPPFDGVLAELCEEALQAGLISFDTCAETLGLQLPTHEAAADLLRRDAPEFR